MILTNKKIPLLFILGSMEEGGVQTQTLLFLKALDRTKYNPVIYLAHRIGPYLEDIPSDIPMESFWEQYAGTIRSKIDHLIGRTNQARWNHLAKIIRKYKIQLVISQTFLASVDAGHACQITGTPHLPIVVCSPNFDINLYFNSKQGRKQRVEYWAFESAQRLIAVSNGIKENLIKNYHLPEDQVFVCPNLLDLQAAENNAKESIPELKRGQTHLLSVGRLSAEKGHDVIIKALDILVNQRRLQNIRWHVLGSGPLESTLKQSVKELNLTEYILFYGFVKNPFPYYKHADLFCLPSNSEAFGCVITEAMTQNLPVLSTETAGPCDILEHGTYGEIVPIGDSVAFANAIEDFMNNTQKWRLRAELGYKHIKNNYDLNSGMEQLQKQFEEVLEQSHNT